MYNTYDVVTLGNDVVTPGNDVVTPGNDVVTLGNDVVTPGNELGPEPRATYKMYSIFDIQNVENRV